MFDRVKSTSGTQYSVVFLVYNTEMDGGYMREEHFMDWMISKGTMTKRPMGDAVSRCRRVERDLEVNLDMEFQKDGGNRIIGLLDYSAQDAMDRRELPGKLSFPGTPINVKNSMASLKGAVKKYMLFCEDTK